MSTATIETIESPPIPLTLPRDAKPSELVRSLSPEHWGCGAYKRIRPDGSAEWCAIGVIAEHLGVDFVLEDDGRSELLGEGGRDQVEEMLAPGDGVLGSARFDWIVEENDLHGKDAAALLLESWGR